MNYHSALFVLFFKESNHILDRKDEGTKPQERTFGINLLQTLEDRLHTIVFTNSHDGTVHGWPSVAAEVRFTLHATTTLRLLPAGESTLQGGIEGSYDTIVMCLIITDKYSFHKCIEIFLGVIG